MVEKYLTRENPVRRSATQYLGGPGSKDLVGRRFEHVAIDSSHLETYSHAGRKLGNFDVGGPFMAATRRAQFYFTPVRRSWNFTYLGKHTLGYDGIRVPLEFWGNNGRVLPTGATPEEALSLQMVGWGAKCVALATPTNPLMGTAQMLGELREGLPRIPLTSKRPGIDRVADEYLNYEFGIKPLVADLKTIWSADQTLQSAANTLSRMNGNKQRRQLTLFDNTSTETRTATGRTLYPQSTITNTLPSNDRLRRSDVRVVKTTRERVWFSGAFTTYYPSSSHAMAKLDRMRRNLSYAYGLELSPELVWELTPYSWLSDWCTSFGSVVHNITRATLDGTIMKYGYVMRERTITESYTLSNGLGYGNLVYSIKQRQPANPFGFGITFESLSPRQLAILGALGMTKGADRLR